MMDIPVSQLRKIESNHQKDSDRCKLEMLQYWLDSNSDAAWNEIVQALEKTDQPALATQIKHNYLESVTTVVELHLSTLELIKQESCVLSDHRYCQISLDLAPKSKFQQRSTPNVISHD